MPLHLFPRAATNWSNEATGEERRHVGLLKWEALLSLLATSGKLIKCVWRWLNIFIVSGTTDATNDLSCCLLYPPSLFPEYGPSSPFRQCAFPSSHTSLPLTKSGRTVPYWDPAVVFAKTHKSNLSVKHLILSRLSQHINYSYPEPSCSCITSNYDVDQQRFGTPKHSRVRCGTMSSQPAGGCHNVNTTIFNIR